MSFFSEILRVANLNEFSLSKGYNVVNYNGEAVYIEGILRLILIDEGTIKAEVRGAIVSILGENLNIFELSDCLIIKGAVKSMTFEPIDNKNKTRRKNEKK